MYLTVVRKRLVDFFWFFLSFFLCTILIARNLRAAARSVPSMPPGTSIEVHLEKELEQAKAGTHQRQKGEEKRLLGIKAQKVKRAEQLRAVRVAGVDARFEDERREVRWAVLVVADV